jgi:endonuclease/exonuclease/phosphatase (EEP) superfamily protein YafD
LAYPTIALAWLWPAELGPEGSAYLLVSYAVFMVRTFDFHAGLTLIVALLAAAFWRDRRLLAAAALPVAALLGPTLAEYWPPDPAPVAGPTIRLMEFNLLYANAPTPDVAEQIKRSNPDLLVLLEYDPDWYGELGPDLIAAYPHNVLSVAQGSFGWAVYSRIPFAGQARDLVPPHIRGRTIVRVPLDVDGREVALYVAHLYPPKSLRGLAAQGRGFPSYSAATSTSPAATACTECWWTAASKTPTKPRAGDAARPGQPPA